MTSRGDIRIIPTCVPVRAEDVRDAVTAVCAFTDAIHLDINDGILATPCSWPYESAGKQGMEGGLDIPVDNFLMQIHLMVSECREIGEFFINAGAHSVIAHVESLDGTDDTIAAWRTAGVQEVGLALLLDTPLEKLATLLPSCDFVHVLSVAAIGAQGAPFDTRAIDRIKKLHDDFPLVPISVDGGVSLDNVAALVEAGATRFSVGSAIMQSAHPDEAYARIKSVAELATKDRPL
jgi:pentose-5-phosphate-3-epimerase